MANAMVELFGNKVAGKSGDVDVTSLSENDVVGIYFSAHWCPPCQMFTPQLAEYYTKLRAAGKKFEIVFVSSDRDEASFSGYYGEMPWLALSFDLRETKDKLAKKYGVTGIPTLVLLDAKTGETISKEGRKIVGEDSDGSKFPWK